MYEGVGRSCQIACCSFCLGDCIVECTRRPLCYPAADPASLTVVRPGRVRARLAPHHLFMNNTSDRASGFTLIELMIVLGIVAIIVAIGMPMYTDQIRQGHRASARSVLLDVAARQRQFMIERRAYAQSLSELGVSVPTELSARYTLNVVAVDGTPPTFQLSATPIGSQASDRCGVLSVDQSGQRLPAGCW